MNGFSSGLWIIFFSLLDGGWGSHCPLETIINQYLNISHLNEIPPFRLQESPTDVKISIFVQSISAVSEVNMEFTVDVYLRLRWIDPRLTFDLCDEYVILSSDWLKKIWLPDIFFLNGKSEVFHDVTTPNIALRVYPNGSIFYSQRISLRLGCVMDLFKFPLDVQHCETRMISYSFTDQEMRLIWYDGYEPVQTDPKIKLPQTVVKGTVHGECEMTYEFRNYSCIFASFTFLRLNGFYVIQIYIPGVLVVMLSWVSFWLDPRATPARVSLGLLCVLTTTTHTTGVNSSLPRVSYVKAMDVWNFTCLLFVFGALLEFALINVKTRKEEGILLKRLAQVKPDPISAGVKESPWGLIGFPALPVPVETTSGNSKRKAVMYFSTEQVDKICRVAFPCAFLIFNMFYWVFYSLL